MSVTPYDFRKPIRLPVDWLQRLNGWFRKACGLANKAWAKQLPAPVEIVPSDMDTAYAQEGLAKLPANVVGFRVQIAGSQLPTFLILPRVLLLQIIGILLGDNGTATEERELSVVEENLADYFLVNLWLPFFREAWPGARVVTWELGERETAPQGSRFYPASEVLLVLPMQMRGPWGVAEVQWFFQKNGILETLGDGPTVQRTALDDKTIAQRKQALVTNLPVCLEFTLGKSEIKLTQLSRLQVGDVLLLDQGNEEGITAGADNQPLFRGRVGRVGSRKAFKIESFLQK